MSNDLVVSNKDIEAAFGGAGLGEFANDIKFPYLSLASKTSDLTVEASPSHVEGLKPGFFFNALTKRVYGKVLKVVILEYGTVYKEYTRDEKGRRKDFIRVFPDAEIKSFTPQQLSDYTKNFLPSGNLLETVKQFHVVLPEFKDDGIMRLEFSKGSFKHVRNWGNMVVRTGHPFPSHVWELTSGMMSNEDNQSWFSIGDNQTTTVKDLGLISDKGLLQDVKESWEFVSSVMSQEKMKTIERPVEAEANGPAF